MPANRLLTSCATAHCKLRAPHSNGQLPLACSKRNFCTTAQVSLRLVRNGLRPQRSKNLLDFQQTELHHANLQSRKAAHHSGLRHIKAAACSVPGRFQPRPSPARVPAHSAAGSGRSVRYAPARADRPDAHAPGWPTPAALARASPPGSCSARCAPARSAPAPASQSGHSACSDWHSAYSDWHAHYANLQQERFSCCSDKPACRCH